MSEPTSPLDALEARRPWRSETWPEFRDRVDDDPRWLVRGLLTEGALAFIAAGPKRGKTWIALTLALSLATGRDLFGAYTVPAGGRPVLYLALEGSRQALRARIGCLARGLGIDPDDDQALANLRMLYRPRPLNLANETDVRWLRDELNEHDYALVIVDVLRRAAIIKENDAEAFGRLRDELEPLLADGRTIALLHHFAKPSDTQKDRQPGERMSGTGAMFGALDVGLYITSSSDGARRMRVELEARDFATPEPLGVAITGNGSGDHGGFTYRDTARAILDAAAAEERNLPAELETLFADGQWRTVDELKSKTTGVGASGDDLRVTLTGNPERFAQVAGNAVGRHPNARPWGTLAMLETVSPNRPGETGETGETCVGSDRDTPPLLRLSLTGERDERDVVVDGDCLTPPSGETGETPADDRELDRLEAQAREWGIPT